MSRAVVCGSVPCGIVIGDTLEDAGDGTADTGKGVAPREPDKGAKWGLLRLPGLG